VELTKTQLQEIEEIFRDKKNNFINHVKKMSSNKIESFDVQSYLTIDEELDERLASFFEDEF